MEDKIRSQHQTKGVAFPEDASNHVRPREGRRAPKSCQLNMVSERCDGKPCFSSSKSLGDKKPHTPIGGGELVKHMSNIPGFLQRMERGDNFQEKALNFGVLGWQHLEKWTDNNKRVSANKKAATYSESSNSSSVFSTFGLSRTSCSSSDSKLENSTDPSLLDWHDNYCSGQDHSFLAGKQVSRHIMGDYGHQITWDGCSDWNQICGSSWHYPPVDSSVVQLKEYKKNSMDFPDVSYNSRHILRSSTLLSVPKGAASLTTDKKLMMLELVPDCVGKCENSAPRLHRPSLFISTDYPKENCTGTSHLNHDTFYYSRERSKHFSFGSTKSAYAVRTESSHKSFAGQLSSTHHSCPLSSDVCRNEWSDMNVCASEHGEVSEGPCSSISCPTKSGEPTVHKPKSKHEKHDNSSMKTHFGSKVLQDWSQNCEKVNEREDLDCMARCSGAKKAADDGQAKWKLSLDDHNRREGIEWCREQHNQLQRFLDPSLNSSAHNPSLTEKSAASLHKQMPCENKLPKEDERLAMHSSSKASIKSCDTNSPKGFSSSKPVSMGNCSLAFKGRNETSMKQTLLQLVLKNGLPILTFSLNEDDVLAATKKVAGPEKKDSECIYTLHLVCQVKRKTRGWIGQGSKNKRGELASRIVGQMNVSCIRNYESLLTSREFVLIGPELRPSDRGSFQPVPDCELAAIVVKVSEEKYENFVGDFPRGSKHGCFPNEQGFVNCKQDIVAILPGEVHGLPDAGKPSPLVDRWKSQGLCDCGGWDAGCPMRILTNDPEGGDRCGSLHSCTAGNAHRVELAFQGCSSLENGLAFSLVAFKEGLYTVHYHASMAPLQAFAVCVAVLHGKTSAGI